jgi:S-DNA-T family DNA segregation ATPase FtsK/SpoIIIE
MSMAEESGCDEDEEIIQQCIEVIRSEQKASVSLLQRRLRLGYGRAARVMDELENRGIVGPSNGAEPREILLDLDGGGADGRPTAAVDAQP